MKMTKEVKNSITPYKFYSYSLNSSILEKKEGVTLIRSIAGNSTTGIKAKKILSQ